MESFFEVIKFVHGLYSFSSETILILVDDLSERQMANNPYRIGVAHSFLLVVIIAQFVFVLGPTKKGITEFILPITLPALQAEEKETDSGLIRMGNFMLSLFFRIPYLIFWVYVTVDFLKLMIRLLF